MRNAFGTTRLKLSTVLAGVVLSSTAIASIDTTDILPPAVNNTQFRYGIMNGTDKKFDSTGALVTQLDTTTVAFDVRTIESFQADATRLVNALNQAGQSNLGNQLHLGLLQIDPQAEVHYFAPIYARGITKNVTFAVAVPVINYSTNMKLNNPGSNAAEIHALVGHGYGAEVEAAFAQMEAGVIPQFNTELQKKGYKPLESRHESLIGDVQLHGLYQFYNSRRLSALSTTTVYLPTGKQDDPDDLTDLGTYGELALEQSVLGNYFFNSKFGVGAKAAYKFVAPQNSNVRVPLNSSDALPDQNRKDTVMRDGGDVTTLTGNAIMNVGERIQLGSAVDFIYKQADRIISGSHSDWDYSTLENNTSQTSAKLRLGAEYFTTTAYTRGHSKIPFKLAYEFANTFSGKNVMNTTVHEIALCLFF